MDIVLLGAGEVGKQLAYTLCDKDNNIVVIDSEIKLLNRMKDKLDVMTVHGDCVNFKVLEDAGISNADIVIATTGNDMPNILACQVAKHFNVKKTVCRLTSSGYFSEKYNYTPAVLGIDHLIFPEDECVKRIIGVLEYNIIVEKVAFKHSKAQITAIRIPRSSPLSGIRILDFPDQLLLTKIRFSAIIRDQKLIMPHGNTIFAAGDEVYVAGDKDNIDSLISFVDPKFFPVKDIILVGATRIGKLLADKLIMQGYNVRLIEESVKKGEELLDDLDGKLMVIHGDPTDADVLEEAGVGVCDAFISTSDDDEENILTCILAKKKGAHKVITITNKTEYVDIVPGISGIDCGFSPRLVAVNSVLNLLGTETARVHAILQRTSAYVYELTIKPSSPICGKKISEYERTLPVILSLVFRDGEIMPVTGELQLKAEDQIAAIATPHNIKQLEQHFKKKKLFEL
jgi:trk system potassium uptake protein